MTLNFLEKKNEKSENAPLQNFVIKNKETDKRPSMVKNF